jgi:predicted RND superfamily exporter protein
MGKRKGLHPVVMVAGIMVIVLLFFIFTPAILGATAANGDLEKYNGSSQQGNDTVRISGALNTYLSGITGISFEMVVMLVALFCVIVVLVWAFGRRKH